MGEIGDISKFKKMQNIWFPFSGLDLKIYESGKFKAKNLKISKKGSKYLRYALYQVARVCWIHDSTLNAYYEKERIRT
ncbi:MAG: IS110 family transposase [Clostridium sp.]|nr:MAG: IS110 family transposase [Clostridium sp.]